jgi:hypothetical protein
VTERSSRIGRWTLAAAALSLFGCTRAKACTSPRPEPVVALSRDGGVAGTLAPTGKCVHEGPGTDYPVGPGQKYAAIGDVPWENLAAGDTVRIHARPEPYHEKIMVGGLGKKDAPIRVCGVPGADGSLPILDGEGATTRPSLDFPYDGHQPRGLVIVGKKHGDPWLAQPEHIVIEGLELRGAAPPHSFKDKNGKETPWPGLAAGIFVQRASHLVIRGCIVHDNGNGLFVGSGGGEELTQDVLIEGNYVYGNGSATDYYEHNVYNEASGVIYQFNRFGPPKSGDQGVLGANIKERSSDVVIRFNWIEDGAHLIDLVDSQEARDRNLADPKFKESWVYGNLLIRGDKPSGSMVHYGGDSGLFETYRKGTLHFFHNTVVISNTDYPKYQGTSIFELSTNDEHLDAKNNVFFSEAKPVPYVPVALLGARDQTVSGLAELRGNWISDGIRATDGMPGKEPKNVSEVKGFDQSLFGSEPGFVDAPKLDLHPKSGSVLAGKGVALGDVRGHVVDHEYVPHGKGAPRTAEDPPSPGAFAVAR